MEDNRFAKFILSVEGIHKAVQKIKLSLAPRFGLKSVHLFWLCALLKREDGMTARELAEFSNINRSLVSREIESLRQNRYITFSPSGRSGYNAKIVLTEKGLETAKRIEAAAIGFQNQTSADISEEELLSFYTTLDKILTNLSNLAIDEDKVQRKRRPSAISSNSRNKNTAAAVGGNK